MVKHIVRRDFLKTAAGAMAMGAVPPLVFADGLSRKGVNNQSELISLWDRQTKEVTPEIYTQYLQDGDTRGLKVLEALENGFEKVLREVKETVVRGNVPAIWSVYNMGYVVKTEKALFSIDLIHRRDNEFASLVDFALITHNHGDHWRQEFAKAVWARKKPVISNFLGYKGYTRAKKVFEIKDVEVRTSLIDSRISTSLRSFATTSRLTPFAVSVRQLPTRFSAHCVTSRTNTLHTSATRNALPVHARSCTTSPLQMPVSVVQNVNVSAPSVLSKVN